MPGPPPTPTAMLKLRGSWRGIVREKQGEPVPPRGRPYAPKAMSEEGRTFWKRLIPLLDEMGVLSRIDAGALGRYCELLAAWWKINEVVKAGGPLHVVLDEKGKPTGEVETRKQVESLLTISDRLLKMEIQFGLTPSARARLTTIPKDADAEIIETKEDFLQLG